MDLLLVPYWADRDLDLIQWPPFLLASKVCVAILSLKVVKTLQSVKIDVRSKVLFSDQIHIYVCADDLFRVIGDIFSEVDKHIEAGDLISECKMSALPSLYDLFVKLIKYLVN